MQQQSTLNHIPGALQSRHHRKRQIPRLSTHNHSPSARSQNYRRRRLIRYRKHRHLSIRRPMARNSGPPQQRQRPPKRLISEMRLGGRAKSAIDHDRKRTLWESEVFPDSLGETRGHQGDQRQTPGNSIRLPESGQRRRSAGTSVECAYPPWAWGGGIIMPLESQTPL